MQMGFIIRNSNRIGQLTSHRELILLESGGILIGNPGMREIKFVNCESGLEITFDRFVVLSRNFRFNDCTHTGEFGCRVLEAVKTGKSKALPDTAT